MICSGRIVACGISLTVSILLTACAACREEPSSAADVPEVDRAVSRAPSVEPAASTGAGSDYDRLAIHFGETPLGVVPEEFIIAETAGAGAPATWAVVADHAAPSPPRVFGIRANSNRGRTYNLALVQGSRFDDLDLQLAVRAVAGEEDRGGGPVWRARDADNYYIARWNPLEDNFRVYVVQGGRRQQLASATVHLDGAQWHTIRIVMRGAHIEASLDGERVLELDDSTFTAPGMIGLWVKADGQTLFDDLRAQPLGGDGA